ncbi:hypothetical protein CA54_47710 [Symmachiella macrocystis]|uniref:Uncharacterized protein n=1 Tax=Symmachiella macrocystis TaxID=2527985 RepID=A0A5C6BE19_9PLAN|nr:hypothetical protein CA54_47710 [Symmachiella macrocystis]
MLPKIAAPHLNNPSPSIRTFLQLTAMHQIDELFLPNWNEFGNQSEEWVVFIR